MGAAFSAIEGVGTTEGSRVGMPVNLASLLNTPTAAGNVHNPGIRLTPAGKNFYQRRSRAEFVVHAWGKTSVVHLTPLPKASSLVHVSTDLALEKRQE